LGDTREKKGQRSPRFRADVWRWGKKSSPAGGGRFESQRKTSSRSEKGEERWAQGRFTARNNVKVKLGAFPYSGRKGPAGGKKKSVDAEECVIAKVQRKKKKFPPNLR